MTTSPPSTHESDIEPPAALQLSPLPSPIDTEYVDDIDLRGSPQQPHESPDPLDIITPAEDDNDLKPSPAHRRAETVQPSPSSPRLLERTVSTVAAEREHSNVEDPSEVIEISETLEVLEHQHLQPSEVVEQSSAEGKLQSDEPIVISASNPLSSDTPKEDGSPMTWKDDMSIRTLSETPNDVHGVGSPLPLEGATASAACTPKTDTHLTEPDGRFSVVSFNVAERYTCSILGTRDTKDDTVRRKSV